MKCVQCGNELNGGKFCTNCGAPAPVQGEQETVGAANNSTDTANQPVDYQYPYPDSTQTNQNNADTNQNTYPYSAQQFSNQPYIDQNGKKPMSGGKIALIIVGIVVGLMIIGGIIAGVVACTAINRVIETADDAFDLYDDWSSTLNSDDSDLDNYYDDDSDTRYSDEESGVVFEWSEDYDGWAVVDYEKTNYDESKITVKIPEQFMGEDVVEIKRLYVFDNDYTDDGYIKIIIPGTVKVIDAYSMSFLEEINEVVIEDGVQIIEKDAFTGDTDLMKVHIPASVTEIDEECGIGVYYNDDYELVPYGNDFTLYCAKGSAAEQYAKKNKINYEIEGSEEETASQSGTAATTASKGNE